jgi:DNA-binding HxlR family transcriptional regulator
MRAEVLNGRERRRMWSDEDKNRIVEETLTSGLTIADIARRNDVTVSLVHTCPAGCAVEATLSVIGGVWKPVLVFHLLNGKLRFNALCRVTPLATPRMITLQLRELEADGIVKRIVFPEVPPKVEYELTELGQSLAPVLLSIRRAI